MPYASKIKYNPSLSVRQNAKKNGVSEAGIRYYLQANGIDRRYEQKSKVVNACKRYLKKHPGATKNEIHRELGYAVSTIRGYWDYITGNKELEQSLSKIESRKQHYTTLLSQIPIEFIRHFLEEHDGKPKNRQAIEERRNLLDELIAAEKKNGEHLQSLPTPTVADLTRWEEYDASKYLCYAFRKKPDKRKGVWIPFGNMNSGFPYNLCGHECLTSESAYICGMFSNNEPQHIALQEKLLKETNGRRAKKDIRHANEDIARKDWYEFNVQWMLYVVWQKVKGNEEFRNLLMAVPDGATIIEDTSFQHGSKNNDTTTFWGAKNNERREFAMVMKKHLNDTEPDDKKGTRKKMLLEELNNYTDFGVFRGCNVMGKILMICRKCQADGTEPSIDYELLRSKHIHLLGEELTF